MPFILFDKMDISYIRQISKNYVNNMAHTKFRYIYIYYMLTQLTLLLKDHQACKFDCLMITLLKLSSVILGICANEDYSVTRY